MRKFDPVFVWGSPYQVGTGHLRPVTFQGCWVFLNLFLSFSPSYFSDPLGKVRLPPLSEVDQQ